MASPPQPAPPGTRILLVDDHALFRRGLQSLITTEPDLMICAEASTHQDALAALESSAPDLVIIDLALKKSHGLDLIRHIKRQLPDLPVLVLSMHDETVHAERALRAGACGYVAKHELDATILIAIRRVLAGEIHVSETMTRQFSEKFVKGKTLSKATGLEMLSKRELEVFKQIGTGTGSTEIARTLGISVKTIESHRENIKAKLQLASGAALNRCAILWLETGHLL